MKYIEEQYKKNTENQRLNDIYLSNKPGGTNYSYDVTPNEVHGKTYACSFLDNMYDQEADSAIKFSFQFKFQNNILQGIMIEFTPIPNTSICFEKQTNFIAKIKNNHIIIELQSDMKEYFIFTYRPNTNPPDDTGNIDNWERITLRSFNYKEVLAYKENVEFWLELGNLY